MLRVLKENFLRPSWKLHNLLKASFLIFLFALVKSNLIVSGNKDGRVDFTCGRKSGNNKITSTFFSLQWTPGILVPCGLELNKFLLLTVVSIEKKVRAGFMRVSNRILLTRNGVDLARNWVLQA